MELLSSIGIAKEGLISLSLAYLSRQHCPLMPMLNFGKQRVIPSTKLMTTVMMFLVRI